jgi:VWFA-related protein
VLVQVPVVVVDTQGNHVRGLSKDDFEVLENNKPQKIAVFKEFTSVNQRLLPEIGVPNTFTNGLGTADQPHSVTILVLDTINTPFLDQAYGRRELIHYLASNLDPGQTFALVILNSKGVCALHGFTEDPAVLVQALKKLNGELPVMEGTDIDTQALAATTSVGDIAVSSGNALSSHAYTDLQDFVMRGDADIARLQQDRAIEATLRGFLDVSLGLSGIPGRKSLIWATGSFPFYLDSPGSVPGGYLSLLYERTMLAMNDAQISVYPVDVRGLVNTSPAADVSARLRVGSAASQQVAARNWLQGSTIDTLRDFAEMTGGKAFYNTNDLATSFHRAAADSASYYLVAYYLDTANRDPGWRKLRVKVHRKDVEVRSRNGFFVTNATVNPELSRKLDVSFAVNSPFESTGVPVSVEWTGISVPPAGAESEPKSNTKKVGFLLRVAGTGISIESGAANRLNLDLLAFAFTGKGTEPIANIAQNFDVSLPDKQLPQLREHGVGYRNTLDLPPGKYMVRFVVRDNLNGRVGSVSAPVTVN